VTEHEDGSLQVELPVANPDAFIGWVLGFVDEAEVIGPPELREKVLARAEGKI
jgi:predicted DNA-binding transcriptional regulator YafY